jgi:tetratricopeptide (TPR) repeat protein
MRYLRLALTAMCVAATGTGLAAAERRDAQRSPSPPLGNNPHPVIWGGQQARPAPPSRPSPQSPPTAHADRRRRVDDHHNVNPRHAHYYGGYYALGNAWGYAANPNYCYPYYSYVYPYVAPPPADDFAESPEDNAPRQRVTNAQSIAQAQKFIGYGDAQFARGKFAEANDRYRKAAQAAPELADALFRQAFVLVAARHYDLAVRAVKRGLALDPRWPKSGFTLDELYRDNVADKGKHLEALAAAAQRRPKDADLVFLVGVYLHFDGQAARAAPFFRLAAQLAAGNAQHVSPFLAE